MLALKQFGMLETKVIASWLFYIIGVPTIIIGIFANIETWKADLLFFLSGILLGVKIIYFTIDKDQKRREKNIDLEEKRFNFNKKKKDV